MPRAVYRGATARLPVLPAPNDVNQAGEAGGLLPVAAALEGVDEAGSELATEVWRPRQPPVGVGGRTVGQRPIGISGVKRGRKSRLRFGPLDCLLDHPRAGDETPLHHERHQATL